MCCRRKRIVRYGISLVFSFFLVSISAWTGVKGFSFDIPKLGEFSFFATEYMYTAWNEYTALDKETQKQYSKHYREFRNNLDINLQSSEITLGIRLKTQKYYSLGDHIPEDYKEEKTFNLEKRFLEVRKEPFFLRLGDSYVTLGRGLVLHIQRDEALLLEDSMDGGYGELTTKYLDLTLLGGKVERIYPRSDIYREDKLGGGRVQFKIKNAAEFGFSGLYGDVEEYWGGRGYYRIYGADLHFSLFQDNLDVYAEYSAILKDFGGDYYSAQLESDKGRGFYLGASWAWKSLVLLAEYNDYEGLKYPAGETPYSYNLPPSTDRDIETNDFDDVKGGRLRADLFLTPTDTLTYVSFGIYENQEGDKDIIHYFGGVEQNFDRFYLETSLGRRETDNEGGNEEIIRNLWLLDFVFYATDILSIQFDLKRRTQRDVLFFENPDIEDVYLYDKQHEASISGIWSPYLTATVGYVWNYTEDDLELWNYALETTPLNRLTVKLFYGESPGGLVCSGGVCREEPEFDGWKLETTFRL